MVLWNMKNASSHINGYKTDTNCGKFCLRGKTPMSAVNWERGPTGEPISRWKIFFYRKISAYSFQAGLPHDFHVIRLWWAKHSSIVSAMHASCDPPRSSGPHWAHLAEGWERLGGRGLLLPFVLKHLQTWLKTTSLPHIPPSLSGCISGNKV